MEKRRGNPCGCPNENKTQQYGGQPQGLPLQFKKTQQTTRKANHTQDFFVIFVALNTSIKIWRKNLNQNHLNP